MISIITSLYKSDSYIEKYKKNLLRCAEELAIKNVQFEVICIANDPTDLEKKTCDELSKNKWFRYIAVPRETLYATWNRGVQMTDGQVCTFWNVDDIRFSKGLIQATDLEKKSAGLVYFPFIYKRYIRIFGLPVLAKRRTVIPPPFDKKTFGRGMHCGPFFAFKKDFFNKVGPFDEQFKIAGDFDWCVRAAALGTFVRSDVIAGIFKNDGRSLSGNRKGLQAEEARLVASKNNIYPLH